MILGQNITVVLKPYAWSKKFDNQNCQITFLIYFENDSLRSQKIWKMEKYKIVHRYIWYSKCLKAIIIFYIVEHAKR